MIDVHRVYIARKRRGRVTDGYTTQLASLRSGGASPMRVTEVTLYGPAIMIDVCRN